MKNLRAECSTDLLGCRRCRRPQSNSAFVRCAGLSATGFGSSRATACHFYIFLLWKTADSKPAALHAGLVILIPAVNRVVQQKLFRAALDELAVIGEPINRVLEVDLNRDEVTLTLYDLPSNRS